MGPTIQLLGPPRVLRDGDVAAPLRGHKAWGLLAYLVLNPQGVSRHQLAALLFEEAEDPLAALRWNLSELRRVLGETTLRGDVIALPRELTARVDVTVLSRGHWSEALLLPGLGRDLLDGLHFESSASFSVWLHAERRHVQGTTQAVLREAALARLAADAPAEAASIASRLVSLDPLDENFQVLLVRCLAAAGDGVGAARQVAACRALFARELGAEPSPALTDALHTVTSSSTARPAAGRAGVLAQLEAGEAAIGAGVLDAGLQCLRRAIADADTVGDPALRVRARVALGGALVHSARGRDEEGAAALHEALAIGRDAAPVLAAAACRELGYVEFLGGRYERALSWLAQAEPLAAEDPAERARIATVQGSILSDTAHYPLAMQRLQLAADQAREAGDRKQAIYAESMLGRALVLCGDFDTATPLLDHAVDESRRLWTAFLPWPLSFRAEIDLARGHVDVASERFEHAFALGCQLGDPCWEGIAGRGRGCIAMRRGEVQRAVEILQDTLSRSGRLPDAYLWGRAYVLETLCQLGVSRRLAPASQWIEDLMEMATRSGMREFVVRACAYRASLGNAEHAAAARVLAQAIDNPVLHALAVGQDRS
jgi:DNA-binding SARP family transcriptional activator